MLEDGDQIWVDLLGWKENLVEIFGDLRGWVAKKKPFYQNKGAMSNPWGTGMSNTSLISAWGNHEEEEVSFVADRLTCANKCQKFL